MSVTKQWCVQLVMTGLMGLPASAAATRLPTPEPLATIATELEVVGNQITIAASRLELGNGDTVDLALDRGVIVIAVTEGAFQPAWSNAGDMPVIASPGASGSATPEDGREAGAIAMLRGPLELSLTSTAPRTVAQIATFGAEPQLDVSGSGVMVTTQITEGVATSERAVHIQADVQTLGQWLITARREMEIGQLALGLRASLAIQIDAGSVRIVRSDGGDELITAPASDGYPVAVADPDPDPEAGVATTIGTSIPVLDGTVFALGPGDVALLSGGAFIRVQGVSEEAATLLTISIATVEDA